MFEKLSYDDFHNLTLSHKRVAVYQEFSADMLTPMGALQALQDRENEVVLLESGETETVVGRYSHIGFAPVAQIEAYGFDVHITEGGKTSCIEGDPFHLLRKLRLKYTCGSNRNLVGFFGGAAGYLSYDAVRYFEDIPDKNASTLQFPDLFFQFFDRGITFDHQTNRVLIVRIVEVEEDAKTAYEDAMADILLMHKDISSIPSKKKRVKKTPNDPTVTPNDEDFKRLLEKGKEYINAGDIFQFVPSRRFEVEVSSSPLEIYRSIRHISPSPYMFYFNRPDYAILGASPEKLISVHGRALETIPLAGTCPRGKTEEEDEKNAKELLEDQKEVAEHMMLVDLGRNDLGAVSKPGTVRISKLMEIQKFSHVMHIASFVQGELKDELDAFDALRAAFPAGTLSGAPKIRAMEIIDELESTRRGPYGGAICFFDPQGNLVSCIGIRMATLKEGKCVIQAGMGVVYDSDPDKEVEESRQKARGMLSAIRAAEEGSI